MAPLGALSQAWVSAQSSLPLGRQIGYQPGLGGDGCHGHIGTRPDALAIPGWVVVAVELAGIVAIGAMIGAWIGAIPDAVIGGVSGTLPVPLWAGDCVLTMST
jgi:hypothetical protein